MRELFFAAAEFQDFFVQNRWRFCLIGGLAVFRWGEMRMTRDVDLTIMTGWGEEEKFVEPLLARFSSRATALQHPVIERRVALLTAGNGRAVDVALGAMPFEESMVKRATMEEFEPGTVLRTCRPEDLIVMKAFADRALDWHDIEGILIRQGKKLDLKRIRKDLKPMAELKEQPEILDHLEQLIAKHI